MEYAEKQAFIAESEVARAAGTREGATRAFARAPDGAAAVFSYLDTIETTSLSRSAFSPHHYWVYWHFARK